MSEGNAPNDQSLKGPDTSGKPGMGPKPLAFDPIAEAHRQWGEHGWNDAADGMAVVTSIIRVEQILLGQIDAVLKPFELTFARYELLTLLDFSRRGALPLGKIGVRLQVHPASVTNAVNRLEKDGLVKRVSHPDDGRTVLATLTPAGRTLARKASHALNEQVFEKIALAPDEQADLFRILYRFRQNSGDFD
ncbi:MAG TPA: MarR family transcriptional regulator [Microthrixaceae bacterium]|nr:MarR family transcriptional regulator [Microthrixaceae bacterium]